MNAEQLKPCPNCGNEKLVRLRAWLTCPACATRYHAITGEVDSDRGMECPGCGCRHFRTDQTDRAVGSVTRKRYCRNCGAGVFTREIIVARLKT